MAGLEEANLIRTPLMISGLPKKVIEHAGSGKMPNGERSKRMLMQCPDCGSGRRSDGYHREGWYWLECGRRYNPETDTYSPENNRCRLKQRDAEIEDLVAELKRLPDRLRWISDNASHHSSAHWLKTQLYGLAREYETGYVNDGELGFKKIDALHQKD